MKSCKVIDKQKIFPTMFVTQSTWKKGEGRLFSGCYVRTFVNKRRKENILFIWYDGSLNSQIIFWISVNWNIYKKVDSIWDLFSDFDRKDWCRLKYVQSINSEILTVWSICQIRSNDIWVIFHKHSPKHCDWLKMS